MNKRVLRSLNKCEKQLKKDLNGQNAKAIEEGLKKLFNLSDKAKHRGVIKKNTASRKKSRFSSKASAIKF